MGRISVWMLILNLVLLSAFSQDDGMKSIIRDNARKALAENDYKEALTLYRDLLNSYPKEPEYMFSTAVCLINLNGDMDEAVRLLKPAFVNDYSRQSAYYLGRALHLNYSFDDAIKAYSKYLLNYKGGEPRREQVERLIEMARNGIEYTQTGSRLRVQNAEIIREDQLDQATEINGSGKLMRKPVEFCSKTDTRSGYRPWIFLPAYTEINEFIYTAGYDALKKNGKQLFRIRNINHETWGIPELLDDMINTPHEEEYPFFDSRTSTLFFSSTGHSSMGGYDIFSTEYNWNTKKWSEPKNLGFPINSPYDDYVYITDGFGNTVSFVSARATEPGKVTVYRLKLEKDLNETRFNSAEEIKKASLLEISAAIPVAPVTEGPASEIDKTDSTPELSHNKIAASSYNTVLAEALRLQLSADSAARITRDLRIMAREMPGDSLKKQNIDEILKNDKLAKSLQRRADAKFSEARKLRADVSPVAGDSVVQLSREVNDIKIYQYRPQSEEGTRQAESKPDDRISKTAAVKKIDQFEIIDQPAYSDFNPIPESLVRDTGLIYRVQLGVFSKPKPNDAFGGIKPVGYEQVAGTSMLKYFAGLFYGYNGVSKALEMIRGIGFPDAFIVAFYNNKSITVEKAKEIEFAVFKL